MVWRDSPEGDGQNSDSDRTTAGGELGSDGDRIGGYTPKVIRGGKVLPLEE